MFKNIIVYVTDLRQYYLAKALRGRCIEAAEPGQDIWKETKAVVLPTPIGKIKPHECECEKLKTNLIIYKPRVYAGSISPEWIDFFEQHQIDYRDCMHNPEVVKANAYITAEATLGVAIANSLYTLKDEKVIVTGFGQCGRAIAMLFSDVGAKVTVLARSREARREAKELGMNSVDFSYAPQEAYGSSVIINTVPAPVIGEKFIKEMHKDCLVIDIASKPGGCDFISLKEYGIKYIHALGLPGQYEQKASGRVLAAYISKSMRSLTNSGEELPWIFQITL